MGREQYKTPEEDVAAEFDRVCQMFQLAMGKPSDRMLFESLMGEASDKGLDWVQGLQYVIEQRAHSAMTERPAKRPAHSVDRQLLGEQELRRAG